MQWPGFRDDGALILPLDGAMFHPPGAPLRLRLDGHVLERKHELHMTVLGREQGRQVAQRLSGESLRALFETFDWKPRRTGRHALLHKDKCEPGGPLSAWSVVEHLQEPAFSAFRDGLARATGLPLDCGVPHVTLYVAGDPQGIGIPDLAAYFACFVREVAATELAGAAPPRGFP